MKDRLYLKITKEQKDELNNHLLMNGYDVEWVTEDILSVNEEECSYIKTILSDRKIELDEVTTEWCPNCNLEQIISAERATPCPNCGVWICPCSACPRTCDCCDCPY